MKKSSLMIVLVFFSVALVGQVVQHYIPIPTKKVYPVDEDYYDDWMSHIRIETRKIEDPNVHWVDKDFAYWNKLNAYYKALTDKSNSLLLLFIDGFERNPHHMCDNLYSFYFTQSKSRYTSIYYKTELKALKVLCECHYATYNQELIKKLETMIESDQKYRSKKYKDISPNDWVKQNKIDSINGLEIDRIVEKYGFPDRSMVGLDAEDILVTAILHSSLPTMEKYLAIIKEKVDNRLLAPDSYPLLYDRIEWLSGRPQLYGTQLVFKSRLDEAVLYEVKNPEGLKERRALYNLD